MPFLYTAKALDETITTQYHYANHFKIDKSTLIPLLDKVLKSKIDLEHGVYSGLIDSIVNTLHYPYVYYIKMIGEMINNDSTNALSTAKDMIRLETPSYLELYKSEFITAKKIINPNFNIADEPTIRVNEDVITLSDVKNGGERPFNITIHNDGEQQLKISNIIKSCSCLELDSINSSFIVPPKDSIQINFIFRAEQQGEIIRDMKEGTGTEDKPAENERKPFYQAPDNFLPRVSGFFPVLPLPLPLFFRNLHFQALFFYRYTNPCIRRSPHFPQECCCYKAVLWCKYRFFA